MNMIRSSAKAVIVKDGQVMLQRCIGREGLFFYELPGGGQNQYETMEEAVVRECLEETGYTVRVERFIALYEEIFQSDAMRIKHPAYAHRIGHVFLCGIANVEAVEPTEKDNPLDVIEWIPLEMVSKIQLHPKRLRESIERLVRDDTMEYLGVYWIDKALPLDD